MNACETAETHQALQWFKSSHSGAEGGQCVEVAASAATIHIRDSKDPAGPWLQVTSTAWSSFIRFAAECGS
ncbi:DUF397 domain-containing protein [Kitasatospora acidiphila]|uniref:DUF397 domain-containing protein n=1 Tax=Kitasatospora acidiphila TaxID=2567942 RepID=A0A540W0P0_9ACTN|nr:DUF397 domain-containing protein [Kitasatospora acidiphila]TQF02589.1 DUF397 domain-containing protein [Kitasatospora acidiphila]